eukprot:jgi/Chrzof1/12180/Cz06g24060.t1
MTTNAPYLMPDGKSLAYHLKVDREGSSSQRHSKRRNRGKDELWAQLQQSKKTGQTEQDIAELKSLEKVGHRRRRRWLNDKLLRDMAGPMTANDMEAQFKPVPFGQDAPPSMFAEAMAPEHAALWDHFRNIDLDKEAKVLQKWSAHNQELQQHASSSTATQPSLAAEAIRCWRGVGRAARAALKRANVHSVLELEMQMVELMERAKVTHPQVNAGEELLLSIPDSFGRLIVHGLAEFHGLLSASRTVGGDRFVAVYTKPSTTTATAAESSHVRRQHSDITCTDVLMAIHELGAQGFNQHTLGRYVRSLHGMSCDDVDSSDYVFV